jgi:hypothetical protein
MRTKRNRRGSSNSSSVSATATIADDDIDLNPEYDYNDNNLFYSAAENAFDHSPTVREYSHNNRSRIQDDNQSLWPLRYRAYKEMVYDDDNVEVETLIRQPYEE